MAIVPYLAMTAAEMRNCSDFPRNTAWLACHFSPYGTGLSNLPRTLPPSSLLIVDDITPIHGHDPEVIARQLMDRAEVLKLSGILLDFQHPKKQETEELVHYLAEVLPCPVAAPENDSGSSPIFLPPVPPSLSVKEYLLPWRERDIWLDVSFEGEVLTLSEDGCKTAPLSPWNCPEDGYQEETLHCHYHISLRENSAVFTLWRTKDDLDKLLKEAETLGVTNAIGLFQEFSL